MSTWPRPDRLASGLAAAGLFLVAWGLVHRWFWAHGAIVDWPTYKAYGDQMKGGAVPYRDFHVEYPPGALPVFVLPSLVGGSYASTFAWLMAACGTGLVLVLAAVRPAAAFFTALAPVLAGSLILSRFDLWPALLATAALVALLDERHALGWGLLGAAVAAKLWPLVLVPLAFAWSYRHGRPRAPLWGIGMAAAAFVPFLVVAPGGLWSSLSGQLSRPLQIESIGAAFLTTFGRPAVITSHGSQNVVGHGGIAALLSVVQVLVLVMLWIGFARGATTHERLARFAAACTCAFVAFDKVLSPQYLLWLIPLVALVGGRRGAAATALLAAAGVLTQIWFPQRYFDYALDFRLAGVVLARDFVLVALVGLLALPARVARVS